MNKAQKTGNDVRFLKFADSEIKRHQANTENAFKQQKELNNSIRKGIKISFACGVAALCGGDIFIDAMQQPLMHNLAEKLASGFVLKLSALGGIFTGYNMIYKNSKDIKRLDLQIEDNKIAISGIEHKKKMTINNIIKDYERE